MHLKTSKETWAVANYNGNTEIWQAKGLTFPKPHKPTTAKKTGVK